MGYLYHIPSFVGLGRADGDRDQGPLSFIVISLPPGALGLVGPCELHLDSVIYVLCNLAS